MGEGGLSVIGGGGGGGVGGLYHYYTFVSWAGGGE